MKYFNKPKTIEKPKAPTPEEFEKLTANEKLKEKITALKKEIKELKKTLREQNNEI